LNKCTKLKVKQKKVRGVVLKARETKSAPGDYSSKLPQPNRSVRTKFSSELPNFGFQDEQQVSSRVQEPVRNFEVTKIQTPVQTYPKPPPTYALAPDKNVVYEIEAYVSFDNRFGLREITINSEDVEKLHERGVLGATAQNQPGVSSINAAEVEYIKNVYPSEALHELVMSLDKIGFQHVLEIMNNGKKFQWMYPVLNHGPIKIYPDDYTIIFENEYQRIYQKIVFNEGPKIPPSVEAKSEEDSQYPILVFNEDANPDEPTEVFIQPMKDEYRGKKAIGEYHNLTPTGNMFEHEFVKLKVFLAEEFILDHVDEKQIGTQEVEICYMHGNY
jgi:hypothetical protein